MPARGSTAPSVIGAGTTFRGDFAGDGNLQVEGKMVGRVDVDRLLLAKGGTVEGDIVARAVQISGACAGSVHARSITLSATAKVRGDIQYDELAIKTGAQLEGQSRRNAGMAVGSLLRYGRSAMGLSVSDISQSLRLRRAHVEALEAGRFGELPGDIYIPAFLRRYATYVGLEPAKILEIYYGEAGLQIERPVSFPADLPRRKFRAAPIGVLVLGAIIVATFYVLWNRVLVV